MYQILIVDEEEHLLWALERNLFPQREDVQVFTAVSGEEGLEILKRESIDLLISDIKMPGEVDGFQLILRAKEMVPDARVMIITAFGTHRIQNFAERIGISHYIEKPFTVEELREAILEILDEKEGFQGVLSDLELTDIIQMLCLAKRTALLHLKHRDHRGRIVFDAGEVVHAEFDGMQGSSAVYEMLELRQGDIFMQSDFEVADRTIEVGWQDLLLEGVKRSDERRLASEMSHVSEQSEASELSEVSEVSEVQVGDDAAPRRTLTPMGLATMDFGLGESSTGLSEGSGMLFSQAELDEMAAASEAAVVVQAEEALEEPREEEVEEEDEAVEAEAEPAGGERKRRGTSPGMIAAPRLMHTEESGEFELFAAPALNGRHGASGRSAMAIPAEMQAGLEEFLAECPGLAATVVVSEGEVLFLQVGENQGAGLLDPDGGPKWLGVFQRGLRCVRALHPSDSLEEIQIALGDYYVLMRSLGAERHVHIAVVERQVSLGIALVLMRQLERRLQEESQATV